MEPSDSPPRRFSLLSVLALVAVAAVAIVGCSIPGSLPTETPTDLRSLLVDATSFPSGWTPDPEGPHEIRQGEAPLGSGIGALQTMSLRFTAAIPGGTGWARQDIYEFSDSKGAADEFEERRVKWFPAGPYDTTWTALSSLVGSDFSADRYYAGCSNQGGIPMCQMLAQYGRYLVRFMATMNAFDRNLTLIEVMTEAQFARLLQDIDE